LQLRRPCSTRDEFHVAATVQSLRKLAKLSPGSGRGRVAGANRDTIGKAELLAAEGSPTSKERLAFRIATRAAQTAFYRGLHFGFLCV
jgi:hypothetical protein